MNRLPPWAQALLRAIWNYILGDVSTPVTAADSTLRRVELVRQPSTDEGTKGILTVLDSKKTWVTGELPYKDDLPDVSCEKVGIYKVYWAQSVRHGWCYHLQVDDGRTDIEIHAANWFGDASKGKKCQLLGCIAMGKSFGILEGQLAVLASKQALQEFEIEMRQQPFILIIRWATA